MTTRNIDSLKAEKAKVKDRIKAIAQKEADGNELSDEEIQEFVDLEADFESIDAKIKRAEKAEKLEAVEATQENTIEVIGATEKPLVKGQAVAIMTRALLANKGMAREAAHFAEQEGYPTIAAALNTSSGAAGGFIVPPGFRNEFIEILRPNVVMRNLNGGCRVVPMPEGSLTMGKGLSSASAGYGAEGDDITKSEPTVGEFKLSKKKLTGLVPVSNDLLRFGTSEGNQFVLDDLVNVVAEREDLAFIRDDGSANLVTGLRSAALAGNIIASSGNSAANIESDLQRLVGRLRANNVRMVRPGLIMSQRSYTYLETLRDANGNLIYPELRETGMIGKTPVAWTTQIPENLGVGSDESEVYLVDFHHAIIGDALSLKLDVSTDGSYMDGGSLVSAFSRDESIIRVIEEHDFGLRHAGAAAVLTGVRWGL